MILRFLCIFLIVSLSGCKDEEEKQKKEIAKPVKVLLISPSDHLVYRDFPGKVEAGKDVDLSFQVSGNLIDFPVTQGQNVKKGDLIASIDPVEFQLKVKAAQADRDELKQTFERAERLLKKGFSSQADYDTKKAQYEIAQSQLELEKQNLEYANIYAPYDGRVAKTYPDQHQYIQEKEKVILLQDTTHLDIVIDVPENIMIQLQSIKTLKRVVVFEGAPEKEYEVVYKKRALQADKATQTYRIYMTLSSPKDLSILPGMTATVKFQFTYKNKENSGESYWVPSAAVFGDEKDQSFVWKIDAKTSRIKASTVVSSELSDKRIRITSGLNPGDRIVIAGVHFLREGQLVNPLKD